MSAIQPAFAPGPEGSIVMRLAEFEAQLLRSVRDDLRTYLTDPDPGDPVFERLFPAPVIGDDEAGDELFRLIHGDLLQARLDGLDEIVGLLGRSEPKDGAVTVELHEDEPLLLLGVLNDLRLAIGARIDITHLDRAALDEEHPAAEAVAIMDHFGMWQEQLLALVDPASVAHYLEEDYSDEDWA